MLSAYDFSLKGRLMNVADEMGFGCLMTEMTGVYA
jgi:hypothetical protein